MPYLLGTNAIRRTLSYLEQGRLILRKSVKVMTVHYNGTGDHHQGARDFVHWHLSQVQYKNPEVQVHFIQDMFPTPFIRCWLDTGDDVLMDVFGKTNVEILDHLIKILGQPKSEKLEMQKPAEIQKSIANFGSGCKRHCLCEIPGQFPCPCVVQMPKHMTGKYKCENSIVTKRGLYKA